jgi:serine/threonine-protein kinase
MAVVSCKVSSVAEVLSLEERAEDPSDFGSLKPGTRLGRYELLVPIARGGMARVWAARQHGQRGFQKLVAIKTILPHLAEEPEFERMFLDEARIASGVHHPNVCEIYELGEEGRTLYLAMEWASGDALSRVLRPAGRAEALDPRVAARVVADACAGAHAAHELSDEDGRSLGVVHRDLSPHNVLLTIDGVAKVCDFGVAKAWGQLHEQTSAGQLKGKVSYMAPEQIMGSPLDRRSDVFSLGCVLYEATTGIRPFRGEGDHQIMTAIMNGELAPPSSIVRHYPADLERIVMRALTHQPIMRYATAELMRFALEEFLAKGPLVTQSNVAQAVRQRIGDQIDRRKERIRAASSVAEQEGWDPSSIAPMRDPQEHRSGVKQAQRTGNVQIPSVTAGVPLDANFGNEATRAATMASLATGPSSRTFAMNAQGLGSMPTSPVGMPASGAGSPGHVPLPIGAPDQPASARSVPSGPGAPESHAYGSYPGASPPRVAAEPEPPPAGAGQYAVAALIGLLCALVIGGGGFFLWRGRHPAVPAPNASEVVPRPTVTAAPARPPASASTAVAITPEITLKVTPAEAMIVVDGQELRGDKRAVPRPAPGKTMALVVRAKGFDEATLWVDYFSPTTLDITLKPILEIDNVPAPKPKSKRAPSLPENPY